MTTQAEVTNKGTTTTAPEQGGQIEVGEANSAPAENTAPAVDSNDFYEGMKNAMDGWKEEKGIVNEADKDVEAADKNLEAAEKNLEAAEKNLEAQIRKEEEEAKKKQEQAEKERFKTKETTIIGAAAAGVGWVAGKSIAGFVNLVSKEETSLEPQQEQRGVKADVSTGASNAQMDLANANSQKHISVQDYMDNTVDKRLGSITEKVDMQLSYMDELGNAENDAQKKYALNRIENSNELLKTEVQEMIDYTEEIGDESITEKLKEHLEKMQKSFDEKSEEIGKGKDMDKEDMNDLNEKMDALKEGMGKLADKIGQMFKGPK